MIKRELNRACFLILALSLYLATHLSADTSTINGEVENSICQSVASLTNDARPRVNLKEKKGMLNSVEWHQKKWQESPAIIDISDRGLNLLFNRPEKVFKLRRGIFFSWGDEYEFSDKTQTTVYKIQRSGSETAEIGFTSHKILEPEVTSKGTFFIRSKR